MMSTLTRYDLLNKFDENHFAVYFRGFDHTGERDVCIVQFLDKFRRNPDRWEQLWQQILSAGRLKHDFLVSVYDYDRERGWVITELMQGALRDLDADALGETELVRTVLYRTLETLDYIHSNQFVHGDVRPASLLYGVAGQTKLSFSPGLSLGGQIPRRENDHAYLAPELFDPSFGEIGVGVDLYGCGMSALSLLLGKDFSKKLLGSSNSSDIAWQRFHLDESAQPSVRELLPHLPRDMETVIQQLISKKVDNRFTSIAEARALLTRPEVEVKIQVPNAPPKAAPEKRRAVSTADVPMAFRETSAPTTKSKAADPGYPPWSREWINLKLKNPVIMASVCGGIFLMMILAMVFISSMKPKKLVAVSVSSLPPGASIFVDDETFEALTDTEVQIPAGEHQLKLELEGYQPHTQTIEIPANELSFAVPVSRLIPLQPHGSEPDTSLQDTSGDPVRPKTETVPSTAAEDESIGEVVSNGESHRIEQTEPEEDSVDGAPLPPEEPMLSDEGEAPEIDTNSIGMEFVQIPAGEFKMGSPESDDYAFDDEYPQHTVRITQSFWFGKTEVTQHQWRAVMGTRPWLFNAEIRDGAEYPAILVSWDDAVEFCKRLSEREETVYRLPTEAEWEYACRGGTDTIYSFGNDTTEFFAYGWCDDNTRFAGLGHAQTVSQKTPNPFGLQDMHGNVSEWCSDIYDEDAYRNRPAVVDNPFVEAEVGSRVRRGGSWFVMRLLCRSASRSWQASDHKDTHTGFRVVWLK